MRRRRSITCDPRTCVHVNVIEDVRGAIEGWTEWVRTLWIQSKSTQFQRVCMCVYVCSFKKKNLFESCILTPFFPPNFFYFFDFFHSISTNYFFIHESFFPIEEISLKFHRNHHGKIFKSRIVLELRLRFFDIVSLKFWNSSSWNVISIVREKECVCVIDLTISFK